MIPQQNRHAEAAGEAFWRFSLALYARPGVAEALIALQDRAGCNVNLMLFALWLGATRGTRLTRADLADAAAAVAALGAVAAALRQLRRQLRDARDSDVAGLRRRIADLEIAAERRVQYRLAASVRDGARVRHRSDRLAAATANLTLYLGAEARSAEAGVLREALAGLMRRA